MGEAIFAGRRFRIDPESVSWDYKAKANDTPTLGGKVVQVYGTEISDMVIEGSFGVGGWRQQEAFLKEMKAIASEQAADYLVSNQTKPPFKFIYPPKGWEFMCYLKAYENPYGGRSVTHSPDIVNPRWRLKLFIVEDNSDLKLIAQNAYIARLSKGLGWRQSEYNGGYGMTDSQTAIENALAQGGAGGGSGSSAGASGDYGFPSTVSRWRPLVAQYFPSQFVNQALSVMQCESGGNPNAVNPQYVGEKLGGQAKGLFQHMDGFWADRSRQAGFAGASIFDPEANIATAAWLFRPTNDWRHWVCKPKVN